MDLMLDDKASNVGGGLQMLLDRWKQQEEKLQAFEDSLKEVNNLMTYQRVQDNLEARIPEIVVHHNGPVVSDAFAGTKFQESFVPSARSSISSEDDLGYGLWKGENVEKDIDTRVVGIDESLEDFEKRIWGSLWGDKALMIDVVDDGSHAHMQQAADRFSNLDQQETIHCEMARPTAEHVKRKFVIEEIVEDKDSISSISFLGTRIMRTSSCQRDTLASERTNSCSEIVHHDTEHKGVGCSDRGQVGAASCGDKREERGQRANCNKECNKALRDKGSVDYAASSDESKGLTLASGQVDPVKLDVNLVSPESCISSICAEDDNLNEITKERASLVKRFMAAEAERQRVREEAMIRMEEALRKQEDAANMHQIFQNQLQLDEEKELASFERERRVREQRYEQEQRKKELQQEVESTNIELRKLTKSWKVYEENMELNKRIELEEIRAKRLEEEKRNTAALKIGWAFRKRRCRVLHKLCTIIQKVVRGFLSRRKVQELKDRISKTMMVLASAVEEGNLQLLLEGSAEAQRLGLHKELGLMKLEFARREVLLLHAADETFQSQSLPTVQAQIMKAKSMDVKDEEFKEILNRDIKTEAQNRATALESLKRVAESGSCEEYEYCLQRASSFGLDGEVGLIQERWESAKSEVHCWLRQVVGGWETGRQTTLEKVKEARRLGLRTLADVSEAAISEKENNVLAGLKTSTMTGTLHTFHLWMRSAQMLGLEEAAEKYSANFRQRTAKIQKGLMHAIDRKYEGKNKALLFEGLSLGLDTEVAILVRHTHGQILKFIKKLVSHTRSSVSRGENFLGNWSELQLQGESIGIEADMLKDLLHAIHKSVLLENKKAKRSIAATFECDMMGYPVSYSRGTKKAVLDVRTLTLEDVASNSEKRKRVKEQFQRVGTDCCSLRRSLPPSFSARWNEVEKLKSAWQQHFFQPSSKVSASRRPTASGSLLKTHGENDLVHRLSGAYLSSGAKYLGYEEEGEEIMDRTNGGDGDDDLWNIPRSSTLEGVEFLPSTTLNRKMLEQSAHCSPTELRNVTKINITHKDLTSLGDGLLSRWCPKLRTFIVDENSLTTLKGAFRGCEESLEHVLVKDNYVNDFWGLESLHNLKVLFLEGNSLSYIGPATEDHPSAPCRSWQGTPRCAENGIDIMSRGCVTSRTSNGYPAECLWPKLKKLCLSNNRITRVLRLGNLCPKLEVLDLGSNELVTLGGSEGRALAGLKNLRLLDVGQNKIKGRSLWKELSQCPLLVTLVASRNRLTELPTHLGSVLLREIWLNGNAIRHLTCKAWLPNLQRFYLQDNLIDNLESLWGCPSLEVLDISFNNLSDLSQLNHLAAFPRLRTLRMNDNPVSDQELHVDKVLEAVPWLTELDSEPVDDGLRDKAVKSVFSKAMNLTGIQFLYEKAARAERPFLGYGSPKEVARLWLGRFTNKCDPTLSASVCSSCNLNVKSEATSRAIIEVMHGKAKATILWAALVDLNEMAKTNPVLKTQLICTVGDSCHCFTCFPYHFTAAGNWSCLALQEMLEVHRKSFSWSRETSLSKEFLIQESQSRPQTVEKVSNLDKDIIGGFHVDRYLEDHLEYTDSAYQEVYSENLEYRKEIEDQLSRVRQLQALARGMLARKCYRRMQLITMNAKVDSEVQREAEKLKDSVLRIQAAWRLRKFKKSLNLNERLKSVTRLQAFWRGFVIRKRFQQALSRLQFIDEDDFDYVAVDENEFALDLRVFEDKFTFYKYRDSNEPSAGKFLTSMQDTHLCAIEDISSIEANQVRGQMHCEGTETPSESVIQSISTELHLSENEDASCHTRKRLYHANTASQSSSQARADVALQGEDHGKNESPGPTSDSHLHQPVTEAGLKVKAHVCGKEGLAEKKKAAIAQIAKDWGFKDERTAAAYMKARAKVFKKVEKESASSQDAQSRFELFKARTEETFAHAPPVYTHVKQLARIPCKIETERIQLPSKDINLVEETSDTRHPPALPAMIQHVGHSQMRKGTIKKSYPWAPSRGKFEHECKYVHAEDTTSLYELRSWHPTFVATEIGANLGYKCGETRKFHTRGPLPGTPAEAQVEQSS